MVTERKIIKHGCTACNIITTLAPVFDDTVTIFDSASVGPLVKVCFATLIVTETFDI
jgi:hypothetical protein